jgi:hypothetical protein
MGFTGEKAPVPLVNVVSTAKRKLDNLPSTIDNSIETDH